MLKLVWNTSFLTGETEPGPVSRFLIRGPELYGVVDAPSFNTPLSPPLSRLSVMIHVCLVVGETVPRAFLMHSSEDTDKPLPCLFSQKWGGGVICLRRVALSNVCCHGRPACRVGTTRNANVGMHVTFCRQKHSGGWCRSN